MIEHRERWQYPPEIEQHMQIMYQHLSEKDRRLYAAIETQKLPRGGVAYIAKVLGCDPKTIRRGMQELQEPDQLPQNRIRRKGGGRLRKLEIISNIDETFLKVVQKHTRVEPSNGNIRQITLSYTEVAHRLQRHGINISERIVKQLFHKHHYKRG